MASLSSIHTHTPALSVIDPRGLSVRQIAFHRVDAADPVRERINRSLHDAAGRRVRQWDPRLCAAADNDLDAPANLHVIHSLTGQTLLNDHSDAGWRVELPGEARQQCFRWDAQGQRQRREYDLLLRVLAVFEISDGQETCAERLTYGGPDDADANQCGGLIRHDDPAGCVVSSAFSLRGQVIEQARRFLNELAGPDWPERENERDSFLEPGAGATTRWRFDASGGAAEQTDVMGNTQRFCHTVSGQLKSTRLQLLNQPLHTLVSDIRYDAHNRIEAETLGNGIVTALDYDPIDGRLRNLRADNGRLQDLHYAYDPVGNVVSIEDRAQPTRYFGNQRIEPLRAFAYDTLYQLIEATGYESATVNKSPTTQSFATANELSNYTQRYEYDAGGNLQKLIHTGARNHTRTFATARYSNRTLLQTGVTPPTEEQIVAGFDANGNLRGLSPGQTLRWDARNQLSGVTPVERESGVNDREIYQYDAAGARVRKVRSTQSKVLTHLSEVRYLPGMEIRSNSATGEELHVITAAGGRSDVRVLHWQTARPVEIENNQARYALSDQLGTTTFELDQNGQLISHEVYYPYGETAWFEARSEVEAKYKAVRYSGKERDATGLYYYGLRYYAPWLCRWLNPDPEGEGGGLNFYQFVGNQPVGFFDISGLVRWPWQRGTAPEVARFIEIYNRENEGGSRAFSGAEREIASQRLNDVVAKMNEQPMLAEYVSGGDGVYRDINSHLRGLEKGSDSTLAAIDELASEYEQLNDFSEVAFRAVKTNNGIYGNKIKPGDVVRDAGYMSASALVRNSINWLEEWTNNLTENPEQVMFLMSKEIPKKVAGTAMLGDHILLSPGEFLKVGEIHRLPSTSSRKALTIVRLKPVGHIERHDIKDIQTGESVMAAELSVGRRFLRRIERSVLPSVQV
ncbi:RHS repeat domain-containing protein [Pseudomonas sp. NPDC088368]|jgi:insecticidal toxin complex protein TccC|uniref:RHS repeat domain-containing protein n=1 Tax=Pseudomonas sp. NPDC088368 TaxID=3364453 RepID=UPI003801A44D